MKRKYPIPPKPLQIAGALFLLAYFLFFAIDGLWAHFAPDDAMNIQHYWIRGVPQLIRAQFEFFSSYLRPMGGLYYLPLFHLAGFHPLPYRAVALFIIGLNVVFFYSFARSVSGSYRIAWLASVLFCFHPKVMDIFYSNAVIYDVLCFCFYFAALACYARIRARGLLPNWRQTAVVLLLYICALNSKEMAVTFPVTLALYELLFHPPPRFAPKAFLIAGFLTAAYIAGKTLGPDPLIAMPGYRPVFTLEKFMHSVTENIQTLFYLSHRFGSKQLLLSSAALLAFARLRKSAYVAFCVLFALSSELPIAFIGRAGSCLLIPLAAWAMLVAAVVWALADLTALAFARTRARSLVAPALVAVFVFMNARHVLSEKRRIRPILLKEQQTTWRVIQELQAVRIGPKPGSTIAILNDPFVDWDMLFLAQLRFRDPSLNFYLPRKTPLPATEIAKMDYLFDYRDGKLVQIKP